jgi:antitoxin ParD1/3/4
MLAETMTITLTADREAHLNAPVASGDFASVEQTAWTLLAERLAEREIEDDDLAWAKPLVDEASRRLNAASSCRSTSTRRAMPLALLL